jgi:microcystin degradation protein MlrC
VDLTHLKELTVRIAKPKLGRSGRPLRIAYGRFFHEANAYSPKLVEKEDFVGMHRMEGEALARACTIRGSELEGYLPHAELTGFVQAARLAGQVTTVPLASSLSVPGGPISRGCFDWLVEDLLERIRQAGRLDGVYLALHGSSEVEGLAQSPEAYLIQRVRETVGADVRIAISYDLHANLSADMIDPIDILIGYRTNPHWDLAPTGFRAGNRLIRTLRGELRPVHAWRKLPMVLGGGLTIDFLNPMRAVFRFMKKLEDDPRVISASLFMVHPYTSADNLSWAVHVCTNDEPALAGTLADKLADRAWAQRDAEFPPLKSAADALDELASQKTLLPVTFVDVDDIVGAGAPGGNTQIVAELVKKDRGIKAMVPVHDPALVELLWDAPMGSTHDVVLRGTPGYGMPEVALRVRVENRCESDFGKLIRLDTGSFHIAIGERSPLPVSPRFWRDLGLDPRRADVLIQKNFFHYRMFYATTSWTHVGVISDGATSLARVRSRTYQVPTYPAQQPERWQTHDATLRALSGRRLRQLPDPAPANTPAARS